MLTTYLDVYKKQRIKEHISFIYEDLKDILQKDDKINFSVQNNIVTIVLFHGNNKICEINLEL